MANKAEYGPHCPKATVEADGRKLTNVKWSQTSDKPQLNLKNEPSNDAMRAIRKMKFQQGGNWSANIESSLRNHVK